MGEGARALDVLVVSRTNTNTLFYILLQTKTIADTFSVKAILPLPCSWTGRIVGGVVGMLFSSANSPTRSAAAAAAAAELAPKAVAVVKATLVDETAAAAAAAGTVIVSAPRTVGTAGEVPVHSNPAQNDPVDGENCMVAVGPS